MKFKRIKKLIAIILVIATLATPISAMAAVRKTYVKELLVASGSTLAEAKQKLVSAGYKTIDCNVNEGNETAVAIGYKTTTKASEAVTDIAIMNMNGGYSFQDYENVLKQYEVEANRIVNSLSNAVADYKTKYAQGNERAKYAYEMLNKMSNEDFDDAECGNLMGDILLSDGLTTDQFSQIALQSTSLALHTIQTALGMANSSNWVETWINGNYDKNSKDAAIGDREVLIFNAIIPFQNDVKRFKEIMTTYDEAKDGAIEDFVANLSSNDRSIVETYNTVVTFFESVEYGSGTLYDFFMQDVDELDYDDMYPIAASMTTGLAETIAYTGIAYAVNASLASDDNIVENKEEMTNITDEVVSIYEGVDRSIFDPQGIAVTSETVAAMTSRGDTNIIKNGLTKESEIALLSIIGVSGAVVVAGVATWVVNQINLTAAIAVKAQKAFAVYVIRNGGAFFDTVASDFIPEATQQLSNSTFAVGVQVGQIMTGIAIAALLIATFIYLFQRYRKITVSPKYSDIPRYIVDKTSTDFSGKITTDYSYYTCVTDTSSAFADLNNFEANQWLALYYTKNTSAGTPILASSLVSETDTASNNSYDRPIHLFRTNGAQNMNQFSSSDKEIYIFFKGDNSATLAGTATSYGTYALSAGVGFIAGALIFFVIGKKRRIDDNVKDSITVTE